MSKIPKKITPDFIKSAIVEIVYELSSPYEVLLGRFHDLIVETDLKYESPTQKKQELNEYNFIDLKSLQPIFSNKSFKIQFTANSIIFINREYVGWDNFFSLIKQKLTLLEKTKSINKYTRVGIRYINHFGQQNLFDNILLQDMRIKVGAFKTYNTAFVTSIEDSEFSVNLRVANKPKPDPSKSDDKSIIDIDVFKRVPEGIKWEELFSLIDIVHEKEKEVFFALLQDSFIAKNKPEYK